MDRIVNRTPLLPVLIGILIAAAFPARSEGNICPIDLELDASHAIGFLNIVSDGVVTAAEFEQFSAHDQTADILKKTQDIGRVPDLTVLADQMRRVAAGLPITDNRFGLARYHQNLPGTRKMLRSLDAELPRIQSDICRQLVPYIPAGRSFRHTVFVVSAVNSSGFAFGPDAFYLVAEAFDGDLGGLTDLAVHEAYHSVQSALSANNPMMHPESLELDRGSQNALALLIGTINEGTATHLAHPIRAGREGAMRAFQYRLAKRYTRDMDFTFSLFDTVLFRAFHDPDAEFEYLERVGLQGNEYFYYVGALMTDVIATADGENAIAGYFSGNPVDFFTRYSQLAAQSPDALPGFSASTDRILNALDDILNELPKID